jgi:hypothetical protein
MHLEAILLSARACFGPPRPGYTFLVLSLGPKSPSAAIALVLQISKFCTSNFYAESLESMDIVLRFSKFELPGVF